MSGKLYDFIIIGGGPAGLTAALYLARFLRNVMVFDAQDGRASMIPKTHNLAPFPDGISGRDLLERMRSHAQRYGATLENRTVSAVEKQGDVFHVTTDRGVETARSIIFTKPTAKTHPLRNSTANCALTFITSSSRKNTSPVTE